MQTVIKDFYRKEDITFHELNGEFIDRFEMHLRTFGYAKLSPRNTPDQVYELSFPANFSDWPGKTVDGWNWTRWVGKRKASVPGKEETCPTSDLGGTETDYGEATLSTTRLNTVKDSCSAVSTGLSWLLMWEASLRRHIFTRTMRGNCDTQSARVKITNTHKESCTCNVPLELQNLSF